MRRLFVLGTVVGVAACAKPPAQPPHGISRPHTCNAPASAAPGEADVGLFALDDAGRALVEAKMQKGEAVVVSLERKCGVDEIEVLACTRPAAWVAEAASSTSHESRSNVEVDYSISGSSRVDWAEELRRARFAGTRGEVKSAFAPPLRPAELIGVDCARATHWADVVRVGSYSARAMDGATETAQRTPVTLHARRLSARPTPMPSFFPRVETFPVATCPAPVAGEPTEQAAQARRLLDERKWADAFVAYQRVALGETGDDAGVQQIAAYNAGIALGELGMFTEAAATLEPIARAPCHLRRAEAAFWLTIRDRRASF